MLRCLKLLSVGHCIDRGDMFSLPVCGGDIAGFLREDPWDAVKKRFQKVGNDLWAYIENVDAADVVVWATMLCFWDCFIWCWKSL